MPPALAMTPGHRTGPSFSAEQEQRWQRPPAILQGPTSALFPPASSVGNNFDSQGIGWDEIGLMVPPFLLLTRIHWSLKLRRHSHQPWLCCPIDIPATEQT